MPHVKYNHVRRWISMSTYSYQDDYRYRGGKLYVKNTVPPITLASLAASNPDMPVKEALVAMRTPQAKGWRRATDADQKTYDNLQLKLRKAIAAGEKKMHTSQVRHALQILNWRLRDIKSAVETLKKLGAYNHPDLNTALDTLRRL